MTNGFLVDTDIIIRHLRGRQGSEIATKLITENLDEIKISVITVSELYAGVKGIAEETQLNKFLDVFEALPVDLEIAAKAGYFKNKWYSSHGSGLADCLIAATADHHKLTLVTGNFKHFPMLEDKLKVDE